MSPLFFITTANTTGITTYKQLKWPQDVADLFSFLAKQYWISSRASKAKVYHQSVSSWLVPVASKPIVSPKKMKLF